MKTVDQTQRPAQKTLSQTLTDAFLWPGETVCNFLNVEDPDSRMLFRIFVNLSVYGKITLFIALAIF